MTDRRYHGNARTDERQGEAEEILLQRLLSLQFRRKAATPAMDIEGSLAKEQVLKIARDRQRLQLVYTKEEDLLKALHEENNDEAQDEDVLHALNEGPGADTSISFYIVSTPSTSRSSTSTIPTPGSRW